jgi:hypothetical protein
MILKLSEIEPVTNNKKKTGLFLCTVDFDTDTYPFFIYLAKLPENAIFDKKIVNRSR